MTRRDAVARSAKGGADAPYLASADRYLQMPFRRCGRSGVELPVLSIGLWQNFGSARPLEESRAVLRRAFDLGVTHFDLANNYGPPYGSAESTFGALMASDFRPYRDEMFVSTKAGYDMWPGPYGQGGGSRKYLLASLDQSLDRMQVDYVDVFYSHRYDPTTPLEETAGALDHAVKSGKSLYVGISSYPPGPTREMAQLLRELGTSLLVHQPPYSMLDRGIEHGLLDVLGDEGIGCVVFSPLAQGLLTGRYLEGVPEGARAAADGSLRLDRVDDDYRARARALTALAQRGGRTLPQLALAWVLRDHRVTSAVIGVSSVEQLESNLQASTSLEIGQDELAEIDRALASPVDGS